ncbi:hypothetical protein [Psychromicrobium xiongbiense]|uniref:hypothetical protein n=1 Tax=Psychromicrobium xiongbiense TaxID=3051184 RepID=UPI002553AA14|nr:hypothetical protein [Psychromicrobium sp. YIM S02556]
MTVTLRFPDAAGLADFRTFVSRARAADDGAIRLQLSSSPGAVLAAWVCVLRPRLLGEGTPTILGLRTMALQSWSGSDGIQAERLDRTVRLAELADRLARLDADETAISLPEVTVQEAWASVSAPQDGWDSLGSLEGSRLRDAARQGMAEVAGVLPDRPGALLLNNARSTVWGRGMDLPIELRNEQPELEVPTGAAFAGEALGFFADQPVNLYRSRRWLRLSSPRGHVLVRPASSLDALR